MKSLRRNKQAQTWPIVTFILAIFVFGLMYFVLHGVLDPLFNVAVGWTWIPVIGNALGWWINLLTYLGLFMLFVFLIWMVTNSKKGAYER